MAQAIQLKRGNNANLGSLILQAGEPAFVLDTGKLIIGNGSDKIVVNPDVGTPGTYTKVTTDAEGRVKSGSSLIATDIPTIPSSKVSGLGSASSKNTGTASGNVPILDANGKLDAGVVPAIAISDTFVVNTQTAMLALSAQVGDVAVRSDLSKSFILKVNDPTKIDNWQELLTPVSPVQSVNSKTGAVTLNNSDVGLGNVTNESKATMFTSPVFTGTPTAPTPATGTNSTQIATTAFVKAQGYLTGSSTIDGGIF